MQRRNAEPEPERSRSRSRSGSAADDDDEERTSSPDSELGQLLAAGPGGRGQPLAAEPSEATTSTALEEELLGPPAWLGPAQPVEPSRWILLEADRIPQTRGLNGEALLRSAYETGRQHARFLRDEDDYIINSETPPLEFGRHIFVVLRAPGLERPVWTKKTTTLRQLVGFPTVRGRLWVGFSRAIEVQAYLFGLNVVPFRIFERT